MPETTTTTNNSAALGPDDIEAIQDTLRIRAFSFYVSLGAIAEKDWDNFDGSVRHYWAGLASPDQNGTKIMKQIEQILWKENPTANDWDEVQRLLDALEMENDSVQAIIDANQGLFTISDDGTMVWDDQITKDCAEAAATWKRIRGEYRWSSRCCFAIGLLMLYEDKVRKIQGLPDDGFMEYMTDSARLNELRPRDFTEESDGTVTSRGVPVTVDDSDCDANTGDGHP